MNSWVILSLLARQFWKLLYNKISPGYDLFAKAFRYQIISAMSPGHFAATSSCKALIVVEPLVNSAHIPANTNVNIISYFFLFILYPSKHRARSQPPVIHLTTPSLKNNILCYDACIQCFSLKILRFIRFARTSPQKSWFHVCREERFFSAAGFFTPFRCSRRLRVMAYNFA